MPESFFSSALKRECSESMLWAIPSVFALQANKNLRNKTEKTNSFHNGDVKNRLLHCTISRYQTLIKAIDSVGDPPLPIPNREVKPNSADGTAFSCGRVGHRHFFSEELWLIPRLFFFYIYIIRLLAQGNTLFPREVKHLINKWSANAAAFSCGRVVAKGTPLGN